MILVEATHNAAASELDLVRRLYATTAGDLRLCLARLAPSLDCDDLMHEVFEVALNRQDVLARAESPRAWLFGVAVKLATTRRRSFAVRNFFGLEAVEDLPSAESPLRTVEQRDASQRVQKILGGLTAAKRDVFVLFELQGLKGEEIAEALGIPLKTVWTRLHHARKDFAEALQRLEKIEARTSGLEGQS